MGTMRTLLALALLSLPLGGIAQSTLPLHISAAALTVQQAQGQAVFLGKVKVTRADFTLTANQLTANYGNTGLTTLTAQGNVLLTRTEGPLPETASAAAALFNAQTNTLTLTGQTVKLQRGPTVLVGDKLVYNLNTQQARVTQQGGPVQATFTPQ